MMTKGACVQYSDPLLPVLPKGRRHNLPEKVVPGRAGGCYHKVL